MKKNNENEKHMTKKHLTIFMKCSKAEILQLIDSNAKNRKRKEM